jgi:hypothetical protein
MISHLSFPKTRNAHRSTRLEYTLSRAAPLIMVMEATDLGHRDHLATLGRVDRARVRTIHPQRQMRSPAMVIGKVADQDAHQMSLVHDDYVIQTLTAYAADEPFHIWILPGRTWGGRHPWVLKYRPSW